MDSSSTLPDWSSITLKVVSQYDPDYKDRLDVFEHSNGSIQFVEGMCYDILLALQFTLNFSYISVKGTGWGDVTPNGTWIGMADQVINQDVDLSIAQTAMTLSTGLLSHLSFLQATSSGQYVALFNQPSASSYRDLLISSFSLGAVLAYLAVWSGVLITLVIIFWTIKNNRKISLVEDDVSFVKGVGMWTVATMISFGWHIQPVNTQFRIVFIVSSFLAFCWHLAVSSEITSSLVTEVFPIRTFEELVASPMQIASNRPGMIKSVVETILERRGGRPQNASTATKVIPQDVALSNVLRGESSTVAFVTFADGVRTVLQRLESLDKQFCDSVSVIPLIATPTAMYVKKNSPLKEALNYNIIMMTESGLLSRVNKQYDINTQIRCSSQSSYRGGLYFEDLRTAFTILAAGFGVGVIIMFVETVMRLMTVPKSIK